MTGFTISRHSEQCLLLSFSREMQSDDLQQIFNALANTVDGTISKLIVDRRNQETTISISEAVTFGKQIGALFSANGIRIALLEKERQIIDDIIANQVFHADVEMATFDNENDAQIWLEH